MASEISGSLQWEGETGDLINYYADGLYVVFAVLSQSVSEIELQKTSCLRFIDPYGDTTFNQLQIPVLINELESLLEDCTANEKRQQFEAVIGFIKKAKDKVHTYIKFYGD